MNARVYRVNRHFQSPTISVRQSQSFDPHPSHTDYSYRRNINPKNKIPSPLYPHHLKTPPVIPVLQVGSPSSCNITTTKPSSVTSISSKGKSLTWGIPPSPAILASSHWSPAGLWVRFPEAKSSTLVHISLFPQSLENKPSLPPYEVAPPWV